MPDIIPFTEAKAHLSAILDKVAQGEEFIITRHNESIAKLSPVRKTSFEQIKTAIEGLRKARKGVNVNIEEIIAWKNEGRR